MAEPETILDPRFRPWCKAMEAAMAPYTGQHPWFGSAVAAAATTALRLHGDEVARLRPALARLNACLNSAQEAAFAVQVEREDVVRLLERMAEAVTEPELRADIEATVSAFREP